MTSGARFTPSLLDAETLERLFVNRHHQLDDVMGRIHRAAATDERAAKLLVGPRGAGKTHLISLVYHRARAMPSFGTEFQLAWLPEDLWTISSFDDLAAEIIASLEPPLETTEDPVAAIIGAAQDHGPIVVLLENLDSVFHAMGGEGQRQLRALLENHRSLLLITTSTRLGDDLLDQAEPFYGFFDTTILEPFDVDEAACMLKRIAELDGSKESKELAARLDEPMARNRLATITHLAGGQPRVWALLAAGLTIDRLDDLVSALVERLDDLTPYYQQQLERLSLNERKAVRALATADGTLTVAELAHLTGIEPRSMAKTITDLRRRGWVTQRTGLLTELGDKRRSYYQLAEPLARLAFQLKESRGRPVKLVVEFLKAWYDHEQLGAADKSSELVARYCDAAYQSLLIDAPLAVAKALSDPGSHQAFAWVTDPTVSLFHPDPKAGLNNLARDALLDLDDALGAYEAGDPEPLLRQPPVISQLTERQLTQTTAARQRLTLARLGLYGDSSDRWVPRLEGLCSSGEAASRTEATILLALHQLRLANEGPADVLLEKAAASASAANASILVWTGRILLEQGDFGRSQGLLEAALPETPPEHRLAATITLATAYKNHGRDGDVVDLWERCTSLITVALGSDHLDALACRHILGAAYQAAGDPDRAIALHEANLADAVRVLGPDHRITLACRSMLALDYQSAGDLGRAIPLYEATLADVARVLGTDHPHTLLVRSSLATTYREAGDLARAITLHQAILNDSLRILGNDHPQTLENRNILARAHFAGGELKRAQPMMELTVTDSQRILGTDHPTTLGRQHTLACIYYCNNEPNRAIPLFETTLADSQRILGPNHATTIAVRASLMRSLRP